MKEETEEYEEEEEEKKNEEREMTRLCSETGKAVCPTT